jgi:hypothetical protein
MAITSYTVGKLSLSRQGNVRTYTVDLIVRTDSPTTGPVTILADERTPIKGASYDLSDYATSDDDTGAKLVDEKDSHCFCDSVSINPRSDKNHCAWTVQAVFSCVDLVPKLSWSFLSEEQVAEYQLGSEVPAEVGDATVSGQDVDNVPVLNSASQKFDPPLMKPVRYIEFRVQQNELPSDTWAATVPTLEWTCNQDSFWGFDPGTVLITDTNSAENTDKGQVFFAAEYKFLVKMDLVEDFTIDGASEGTHVLGHLKRVLDQGCMWYDAAVSQWKLPVDANGVAHTSPVLLDGTGKKLEFGKSPQFLEFSETQYTDWSAIPVLGSLTLSDLLAATQEQMETIWYP